MSRPIDFAVAFNIDRASNSLQVLLKSMKELGSVDSYSRLGDLWLYVSVDNKSVVVYVWWISSPIGSPLSILSNINDLSLCSLFTSST